jgi:hypothetical protein
MVKGNEHQEEIKRELYNRIREYKAEITACKMKIDAIDLQIIQSCVVQYGSHQFELEVECSLYGESYHICKNCGYEC